MIEYNGSVIDYEEVIIEEDRVFSLYDYLD